MKNNTDNGHKLAEGGYGCVWGTEITCKGKRTKNKKHLSKLQFVTFSSKNETMISREIIKKYKNYSEFFSPIISTCNIKIKKLDDLIISECSVLNKMKGDEIEISKIKYIDNVDYEKYVLTNISEQGFFYNKIIKVYYKLLKGIKMLADINIVHFDLKGLNIIYDTEQDRPIIIDFGLSFKVNDMLKNMNSPKYYYYFYRYVPEYYIWPLEVHFMNLLLHKTETPTDSDLKALSNNFVNNNAALLTFSNDFKNNYYTSCYEELLSYNDLTLKQKKEKIMNSWNTWDNYSLSIILIVYIYYFCAGGGNNKFTNDILELVVFNIHPNYKKRFTIDQSIHKFKSLNTVLTNTNDNGGDVINKHVIDDPLHIKNKLIQLSNINRKLNSFTILPIHDNTPI
jgi:serine/threonine protein kinase